MILDGAPEPARSWPTSLEEARTPALDALCATGCVGRLRTTPDGLQPGSETGVPVLLGAELDAPVGRGPLEANAAAVEVPDGSGAWRLDVRHGDGRRASEHEVHLLLPLLRAQLPQHRVTPLRGHRVLAVGPGRPVSTGCAGLDVTVWPDGAQLAGTLDRSTTMVCGRGAAAGIGRLLGARVVVPDGATGDVDTRLGAKAAAALLALERGDDVVVHLGGADEAAHRGDRDAKRAFLEAADARLIAPLGTAARASGATLAVASDHGTCPRTGRHDPAPVPFVVAGPDVPARGPQRLTERAVADEPVADALWLGGATA
jgi:2,3-bisphosphoglycerate-independent phosphoglycerate mutase